MGSGHADSDTQPLSLFNCICIYSVSPLQQLGSNHIKALTSHIQQKDHEENGIHVHNYAFLSSTDKGPMMKFLYCNPGINPLHLLQFNNQNNKPRVNPGCHVIADTLFFLQTSLNHNLEQILIMFLEYMIT